MYRAMDGITVTSVPLPDGDVGVRKTVENMRVLADRGSRDPQVREAVIRAIRSAGVAEHNVAGQVDAWFKYVRDSIYFLNDPAGSEWLQSPRVTLMQGAGDCDDRATLIAAGLQSFGVRSRFKVIAVDPNRRDAFSHVYVVALLGGREVALDATYHENAMGFEHPRPYRAWTELV